MLCGIFWMKFSFARLSLISTKHFIHIRLFFAHLRKIISDQFIFFIVDELESEYILHCERTKQGFDLVHKFTRCGYTHGAHLTPKLHSLSHLGGSKLAMFLIIITPRIPGIM